MEDLSRFVFIAGAVAIGVAVFAVPSDFFLGVTARIKRRYGIATIAAVMTTFAIGGTLIFAMPGRYPLAEVVMGLFGIGVFGVFAVEQYAFWRTEYRSKQRKRGKTEE